VFKAYNVKLFIVVVPSIFVARKLYSKSYSLKFANGNYYCINADIKWVIFHKYTTQKSITMHSHLL